MVLILLLLFLQAQKSLIFTGLEYKMAGVSVSMNQMEIVAWSATATLSKVQSKAS